MWPFFQFLTYGVGQKHLKFKIKYSSYELVCSFISDSDLWHKPDVDQHMKDYLVSKSTHKYYGEKKPQKKTTVFFLSCKLFNFRSMVSTNHCATSQQEFLNVSDLDLNIISETNCYTYNGQEVKSLCLFGEHKIYRTCIHYALTLKTCFKIRFVCCQASRAPPRTAVISPSHKLLINR